MAPKAVSKNEKSQRTKVAEDKTFGMKNKNKSKVVQKYIKSITLNAEGKSNASDAIARKTKDDKEKAVQNNALMNSLFNMATDKKGRAYDAAAKKKAKEEAEEAIAAGKKLKEEVRKDLIEGIANTIRLTNVKGVRMSEMGGHPIIHALKEKHKDVFVILSLLLFIKANNKVFWVDDDESTNPSIRCQDDVDAETAPDDRPIEEIIEEKRRALPPGGTMVTEETFKAWKIQREKDRLLQVEEDRKNAQKKDKNNKYAGISGKDLFTFDSTLFVDAEDEGAVGAAEYDDRGSDPPTDDEAIIAAAKAANKAAHEVVEDDEEDEDDEDDFFALMEASQYAEREDGDAKGSADAPEVAINKDLFLEGGDLPDDLDDLDDLDDD